MSEVGWTALRRSRFSPGKRLDAAMAESLRRSRVSIDSAMAVPMACRADLAAAAKRLSTQARSSPLVRALCAAAAQKDRCVRALRQRHFAACSRRPPRTAKKYGLVDWHECQSEKHQDPIGALPLATFGVDRVSVWRRELPHGSYRDRKPLLGGDEPHRGVEP